MINPQEKLQTPKIYWNCDDCAYSVLW